MVKILLTNLKMVSNPYLSNNCLKDNWQKRWLKDDKSSNKKIKNRIIWLPYSIPQFLSIYSGQFQGNRTICRPGVYCNVLKSKKSDFFQKKITLRFKKFDTVYKKKHLKPLKKVSTPYLLNNPQVKKCRKVEKTGNK